MSFAGATKLWCSFASGPATATAIGSTSRFSATKLVAAATGLMRVALNNSAYALGLPVIASDNIIPASVPNVMPFPEKPVAVKICSETEFRPFSEWFTC